MMQGDGGFRMPNTQLDVLTAGAIRRAMGLLSLRQLDLAKSADVAQGTVSNLLRGKQIQINHAAKVLDALSTAAAQTKLPADKALLVTDALERAGAILSGELVHWRRLGERAPSDSIIDIMDLADGDRLNL